MNRYRKRLPLWLATGLTGLVLLTACSSLAAGGDGPVTADENQQLAGSDESVGNVTAEQAAAPEPASEKPEGLEARRPEVTILAEDDRSNQLRALTATWNTDWTRHTVEYSEILSGGPPRDGIQSIDDPSFVSPDKASTWLADNEPVIVLDLNGDARAYPLQIITWHEIVNDAVGGVPAVVTFCPLCNSALAFDSRVNGQALEFGVSGLLRNSDLIMYDRTTESLWQQFTGDAIVGELTGTRLTFLPTAIISFADFRAAHPDGIVLSQDTGFNRPYGTNPYAGYDSYQSSLSRDGNLALFRGEIDSRLEPAARVVTVSLDDVGIDVAYPVTLLSELGVINDNQGGQDLVVFFRPGTASALGERVIANAEDVGATGVFDSNLNGQKLTFQVEGEDIIDEQTGSTWNILGQAIEGPLAGEELAPIIHGDHFWFSWAAFKPNTIIYQG